jgi:hypothetical protein
MRGVRGEAAGEAMATSGWSWRAWSSNGRDEEATEEEGGASTTAVARQNKPREEGCEW